MQNISYRVIYSNFLKALKMFLLESNKIIVYTKELFSLEGFLLFKWRYQFSMICSS